MRSADWDDIVRAVTETAVESGRDVAEVSLDEVARRVGISRATLYRRIGSRRALDDAVRAAGVDPGGRPDVRARATAAAADLIEESGLAALTLEGVAVRAECSLPALYSQLGGRDKLLAATFERFSPLPKLEDLFAGEPPPLEEGVRQVYRIAFATITARPRLFANLLADAVTRPDGPTSRFILETYLPRAAGAVGGWLAGQRAAGRLRPYPLVMLVQLLFAPVGLHAATRTLLSRFTGEELPPVEEAIELFAGAYLRAVGMPSSNDD